MRANDAGPGRGRTQVLLLAEDALHASYLLAAWNTHVSGPASIALRSDRPPQRQLDDRVAFHQRYGGRRDLPPAAERELADLYPDLDDVDRAMIRRYGLLTAPPCGEYVGDAVNGERPRTWFEKQRREACVLFVFLDRILDPWWITMAAGRIVNAHSAVLPHARGMFAIEQVAALKDPDHFRAAAGGTVHLVDTGVDTGPVIESRRLRNPFVFPSLWECKGASFMTAFDLLVELATRVRREGWSDPQPGERPPEPFGSPLFTRSMFTRSVRAAAVTAYMEMQQARGAQPAK